MTWTLRAAGALAFAALAACSNTPTPPDAATLMRQAEAAMGPLPKTLVITGRGTGGTFGQAWQPATAWPALNYSTITRALNLDTGGYREGIHDTVLDFTRQKTVVVMDAFR